MPTIDFEREAKFNSDFINLLNPGKNTSNWIGLMFSLGVYGLLIGIISAPEISSKDKRNSGIALASLTVIGIFLSILRFPLFSDTSNNGVFTNIFNIIFISLFGLPVYLTDVFLGYTSKGIPGGMKDLSHTEIHENFGSGLSRVKGLNYDADSFTVLGRYRYRKGSSLPCSFDSGTCTVRRSVIYIAIILSLIIVIPFLVTIEDMKGGGFDISHYLGYLNSIIAGFLGVSIAFILGTVRNSKVTQN